jgi:uncharacterized protein (TIGR02117 family)
MCLPVLMFRKMVVSNNTKNKLIIIKDKVHSDYVFESKIWKLYFPTNKKYIGIGWGDKSIYCETNSWDNLELKNIIKAFFGMNETVMHIYFFNKFPKNKEIKVININNSQLNILKKHILKSFVNFNKIKKEKHFYKKGSFYKSNLKYNCINTCNNWINTGLLLCNLSKKFWCPISFWIAHEQQFHKVKKVGP